jgi:aryl-alcohol dehydrogenase-like predicted oxidoreductase
MPIEKRRFGRTGHMSSAVIFGAAALARVGQATADRALDLLPRYGVNHIDVAARYGDAEERIGDWFRRRGNRGEYFLATKTGDRDKPGAYASIRRSLDRLKTDRVDLIQLHALYHPDEWERALGPGGALEACLEARAEGLARFIGVTGHGWTVAAMHRRALERFDFDSILMPWNWFAAQHATYAPDFERTAALARSRDVAVQTIKGVARGPWSAGARKTARPGISPSRRWTTSALPCIGCSAGPASSCSRPGMSAFCRWCSTPRRSRCSSPAPRSWRRSANAPASPRSSAFSAGPFRRPKNPQPGP